MLFIEYLAIILMALKINLIFKIIGLIYRL
jgi:hypothetical protein